MGVLASFFGAFDRSDLYVILFSIIFTLVVVLLMRKPIQPGGWDHFWQNFDKLLAVFLFGGVLLFLMHLIHHGQDAASVQWAENLVGQIWSSIAILLGVAKVLNRMEDKNKNADSTQVARTTTTVEVTGTTIKTLVPPVTDGN